MTVLAFAREDFCSKQYYKGVCIKGRQCCFWTINLINEKNRFKVVKNDTGNFPSKIFPRWKEKHGRKFSQRYFKIRQLWRDSAGNTVHKKTKFFRNKKFVLIVCDFFSFTAYKMFLLKTPKHRELNFCVLASMSHFCFALLQFFFFLAGNILMLSECWFN